MPTTSSLLRIIYNRNQLKTFKMKNFVVSFEVPMKSEKKILFHPLLLKQGLLALVLV